jgi:hypothetical protein
MIQGADAQFHSNPPRAWRGRFAFNQRSWFALTAR